MPRPLQTLLFLCICTGSLFAQDLEGIQIHGFATQGFLFSSANNYLSMKSSEGSLAWTDGAVSVIDSVSPALRVGIQLHTYQLGDLGGSNIQVDWASGDYRLNDYLGFRGGKVKTAPAGSQHISRFTTTTEYAQFERGKFYFAGEYRRTPLVVVLTIGPAVIPIPLDERTWYVMGSYRMSERFQFGSYYSHSVNVQQNTALPENYSKDWVISGRCNFNSYFYAKLEGHLLHGTGLGYFQSTNPRGLKSGSNMLAAKLGFSF